MKVAIVAGGTGGHIYPGISLGKYLINRGHQVTFFGCNDRLEKKIIPPMGYDFIGLDIYSTSGNKIKSLLSLYRAYKKCLTLLKGYDMAIGFGNYISIPLMLAAIKLKMKTVIHEQNSFVGKANRFLDKKVDLVIGSYQDNLKQFKNPNTKILGNPKSQEAYELEKDPDIINSYGLDSKKKTLLIFMGSLGSKTINQILLDYFKLTDGSYQIIYATGQKYFEEDKDLINKNYIKVLERVEAAKLMKSCDLLLSRAGATTICEICATGIPAIIIPSPYVPNNHQYYNGLALENRQACIMLQEDKLEAKTLNETINELINDEDKLKLLKENAKKMANKRAIDDIIKELEKL